MGTALFLWALLAAPPDHSKAYFKGLDRPRAERVRIDRQGGPLILMVVDALRPDRLSAYGFERPTTPNLKRLADEGLVLTNYFVNGPWTRPTTATMLTGLPPAAHGVENERDRLQDDLVTLAELAHKAGFPTGAVVGNGNAGSAFGLARGFSFYADTVNHWKGLPSADEVVEVAMPFVREHAQEAFFLLLFFVDPHDPYHAPEPYENMFVTDPSVPLVRTPHWEIGKYTPQQVERMRATYDGAVRYTDAALGRFFDALKALGVYDKATLIVTADHGEAFGEHGVFLHSHHLYDEIIRAPFIIRAPGMSTRGAYNHYLFQTIDLLPTIVRYYGGKVPEALPGANIFRLLRRPGLNNQNRFVVSEFHNFGIRRRVIRTYTHKIIHQEPANEQEFAVTVGRRSLLPSVSFDADTFQFYAVGEDPFEHRDLYTPEAANKGPWPRLLKSLRRYKLSVPTLNPNRPLADLDPETIGDLKALGYIQ